MASRQPIELWPKSAHKLPKVRDSARYGVHSFDSDHGNVSLDVQFLHLCSNLSQTPRFQGRRNNGAEVFVFASIKPKSARGKLGK